MKYITRRFIMEYDPYIEDIYTKHKDVDGQEFIVNVVDTFEKRCVDPESDSRKVRKTAITFSFLNETSLTVKYITRRFIIEYDPYIEDIYTKHEDVDGQEFIVNVMDTFEKDDSNNQRYLRWADAFIVVYSITNRSSFETARQYLQRVAEYLRTSNKDCPIALVGNKSDLERYRQISKADGQTLSCENDGIFYECSAAEEYEYVEDIFYGLVHSIQRQRGERSLAYSPLFITEDRYHSMPRNRPRSPRSSTEKKVDKSPNKKNQTSFKLLKSFKIFN